MKRLHFWILVFVVYLVIDYSLTVEAKSSKKNKDKKKDKYQKTEGSAREAKSRYSKTGQEEHSKSKYTEEENENTEAELPELEVEEEEEEIVQEQKSSRKEKKGKKPYTITVEASEEPVSYKKGKGSLKVKAKKVGNEIHTKQQKKKEVRTPLKSVKATSNEDGADFIVHVPKSKKGGRHRIILEVPADEPDMQEEEREVGNAIQTYITEEDGGEIMDENCTEDELDGSDPNMCYYG